MFFVLNIVLRKFRLMKHCLIFILSLLFVAPVIGQGNNKAYNAPAGKDEKPHMTFDFNAYSLEYIKKHNTQGKFDCNTNKKVTVKFKLLETGLVDMNSFSAVRNPAEWSDEAFKNEAIRFIKEMPGWTPGYIDGKPSPMDMEITVFCKTISGV